MTTELKKKALSAIVTGIGLALVGFVANALIGMWSARLAQSFALLIALGNAIFILGCIWLARAKGHPWYVGLLGLLSCIGLAVLWFLVPDRA